MHYPKSKTEKQVPQRSIIGPLLFVLKINDIKTCSELRLVHFADDSTAYDAHGQLKIHPAVNKKNIDLIDSLSTQTYLKVNFNL